MVYLSLLIMINLVLTALAVWCVVKRSDESFRRDIIKHFGMLEITWSTFSLLLGTALIFSILEASNDGRSFLKVAGNINVVALATLFGFGIFHFFFSIIIFIRTVKHGSL